MLIKVLIKVLIFIKVLIKVQEDTRNLQIKARECDRYEIRDIAISASIDLATIANS